MTVQPYKRGRQAAAPTGESGRKNFNYVFFPLFRCSQRPGEARRSRRLALAPHTHWNEKILLSEIVFLVITENDYQPTAL